MRPFLFSFALILAACQSPETSKPKETPQQKPNVLKPVWDPPLKRLATPKRVLDLRLKNDVGTFEGGETKQPLVGFGLNACQPGYYLQGYTRTDGELNPAPLLHVPRAKIPTGKSVTPLANGAELHIDAKEFNLAKVDATLEVKKAGVTVLKYVVNGTPSTVANTRGLGSQGCFTTGVFSLEHEGRTITGPVTAVYDNATLYVVVIQLTEQHHILFQLDIRPHLRKPGAIIRGSLRRVLEEPKKFPFRTTFVERTDDDAKSPPLVSQEWIAADGDVYAAWQTEKAEGPIRVALEKLNFPKWDGPLSGEMVEIKVVTSIVADPRGIAVPQPASFSEATP